MLPKAVASPAFRRTKTFARQVSGCTHHGCEMVLAMWTVPFALLAALSLQDAFPPPHVPVLVAETGKFAMLEASEDRAVGIDLASIHPDDHGRTNIDAYFLHKTANVDPVVGVVYSRVLPSDMTKGALVVDCSAKLVSVTSWSRLTDLGYSTAEFPSSAAPITPQALSSWGAILHVACSASAQDQLLTLNNYVSFYDHMEQVRVTAALRATGTFQRH